MTQLNTPHPSTAYLTGFLRSRGIAAARRIWRSAGAGTALAAGPRRAARRDRCAAGPNAAAPACRPSSPSSSATAPPWTRWPSCRAATHADAPHRRPRACCPRASAFAALDAYGPTIPDGGDPPGLGLRCAGHARPRGATWPRSTSTTSPTLRDAIDPRFEFVRYAEHLATSQPTFDPLARGPRRAAQRSSTARCSPALEALARHAPSAGGAAVGAPSRLGVMRGAFASPDDQGEAIPAITVLGRRLRQHRAARAGRAARCSTSSTDPSTTASGRCWRCIEHLAGGAASATGAHLRARRMAAVRYINRRRARHPLRRDRHADLGRPAAGRLPVAARHAQPDAPAVVRRALETSSPWPTAATGRSAASAT